MVRMRISSTEKHGNNELRSIVKRLLRKYGALTLANDIHPALYQSHSMGQDITTIERSNAVLTPPLL